MNNDKPVTHAELDRKLLSLGFDTNDSDSVREWHADQNFLRRARRLVMAALIPIAAWAGWEILKAVSSSVSKGQGS